MNGDSGEKTCPLTKCVHFLEFSFIRDFTALVSFSFFCTWAGDQYSFSRTTSLLIFLVPKTDLPTNCLSVFGHFVGLVLKGLTKNYNAHILQYLMN